MGKDLKGKEIGSQIQKIKKPSGGKTVAFGSVLW